MNLDIVIDKELERSNIVGRYGECLVKALVKM